MFQEEAKEVYLSSSNRILNHASVLVDSHAAYLIDRERAVEKIQDYRSYFFRVVWVLPRHLEEIKDLTKHGHSFLLVLEVHRVRQLLKLERHNRHKLQQNNEMIAAWKNSPLLWARLLLHKICGPPLSARRRVAEVGSLSEMATQIFVKCVFAIFATNALFLRIIANLQI